MLPSKKIILIIVISLIFFSVVKDLKDGSPIHHTTEKQVVTSKFTDSKNDPDGPVSFQVISYKVSASETFISIIDQINNQQQTIDIEQAMVDFKALNPKVDILDLQPETTYLFPMY
ncbi:hypothetical protein GCM10011351_16970 [Paraliobacillus quinghaiensis]|uniref:LysM domain-containing protein n=1 Tax=Paraliobacillus quinghaiensis TaxID=470815 RepID=A0A917TQ21_9BACI|nr:hypothetical protein [Paraliobacillus quinghaiensis]GGM31425.1 hypothetical protein GCM10011351_16970 [Paraliobacillus quinghaiensis]